MWIDSLLDVSLVIQATPITVASVVMNFGCNRSCFYSLTVSLCLSTVTAVVTPVSHTPDLQLCQISSAFPNR